MEEYTGYALSAIRALLGAITNNVRAVLLGWNDEKIYIRFVTINSPFEEDVDKLAIAGTEIASDFPEKEVVESILKSNAAPSDLLDDKHRHFIFLRSD